jgi:tetratricopeptide (TPR) repeat protein
MTRPKKSTPPPEPRYLAVDFFNTHPEATVDPRPATEKLSEIESALKAGRIGDPDLFAILIQKKALCDLEFGSDSIESVVAGVQLGALYNRVKRYDSANRHLRIAFDLSVHVPLVENDRFRLAVEFAEAVFALAAAPPDIAPAEQALFIFSEKTTENRELRFRRDILVARMRKMRKKYAKALPLYERAISSLIWFRETRQSVELADLYLEGAEIAIIKHQKNLAREWCAAAADIHNALGVAGRAADVAAQISDDDTAVLD